MSKSDNSKHGVSLRRIQVAVIFVIVTCVLLGCDRARLDDHLCPVDKPPDRQTILLLDTSDPLTPKHRSELRRFVKEILKVKSTNAETSHFYVAPGEALIVYGLTENLATVEPAMIVCNPGNNPDEWTWKDDLTRGKAIASHQWRRLEDSVESLFSELELGSSQTRSPILEMLGVIVPRHAPSKRSFSSDDINHTHLILFSDLLQHSDLLSHYGPYPAAKAIKTTSGLRSLQTDLTGIDVSLFRLERTNGGRWQTRDHYYWWTELVMGLGGVVRWQESI